MTWRSRSSGARPTSCCASRHRRVRRPLRCELWLAPIRFEGGSVYLVQAGRPVGGRFAPRGATGIALHDDVDEARNLLIQDMMYSGGLEKLGFVTGVGDDLRDAASNRY